MIRRVRDERCLIAAYRDGLGLAAVVAARAAQGVRILAVAADEATVADAATIRWWCRNAADAARIAAAAGRTLRRESNLPAERPADESALRSRAAAAVRAAADKLGAILQSDEDVAAEALTVAARVEAELQQQQQSGGLKAVNKAYRAYRLDSRRRGERALRYDQWMEKYKENLMRQAALTLRQI